MSWTWNWQVFLACNYLKHKTLKDCKDGEFNNFEEGVKINWQEVFERLDTVNKVHRYWLKIILENEGVILLIQWEVLRVSGILLT